MNIAEMRRKLAELKAQAKALMDKAGAEKRDLLDEERSQIDALIAQAEALDADIRRAEKLEGFQGVTRPAGDEARRNPTTRTADSPMAVTLRYIRTGDVGAGAEMHAAAQEEYRASNDTSMNIGSSADGGYLVPTGHFNQIIARRDEMMLATALGVRLIPGVGTTVNVPVDDEADGEFIATAEQSDNHTNNFDRDAPALNRVQMTLAKYTKKIELTDELLLDNDSNLEAFLVDFVGRGMAKTHNNLLLTEVLANGTAALTLDSATAIGASEIPELVYLLPQEYEDGAAWVMRRATEGKIRALAGDAFQFAITPGGSDRTRRDLWGFPSYTSAYAGAVQASGKSLTFGNFNYVGRRDAPTLTLLRDPYTVDGMVVLKYYFRTVYKVLQAEAVLYATHPTA